MPMLHEPAMRSDIVARVRGLRPENNRRWGRLSIDQMLWHLNHALLNAIGDLPLPRQRAPLPGFVMRAIALNLPWPKGTPTAPGLVSGEHHDFQEERQRCIELINRFAARDIAAPWEAHMAFGRMSGRDWSRLMYKHIDHHLRQFSA